MENGWSLNDLASKILPVAQQFRRDLNKIAVSTKPDNTFLTEADLAIQEVIVEHITSRDPAARIIAEEDWQGCNRLDSGATYAPSTRTWVVDPIDGTSQFINPEAIEFCIVVAVYTDGYPSYAMVLAPELGGHRRHPLLIVASAETCAITLNGRDVPLPATSFAPTGFASTTRSRNTKASAIEIELKKKGYKLKTQTTSQTLDMVRTAIDLDWAYPNLGPKFDLFYRRSQKLWDGAAGFCLAVIADLPVVDDYGRRILPLREETLQVRQPVLPSSIVGRRNIVAEIVGVNDGF